MKNPFKAIFQPFVDSAEDLRELSKGATRAFGQFVEKAQDANESKKPLADSPVLKPRKKTVPAKKPGSKIPNSPSRKAKKAPAVQAPAEHPDKNWLLKQAAEAIHRTYYLEGGFRFFAQNLCRYIRLVLPNRTDPEEIYIDTYNSCLRPILHQLRKLATRLEELKAQWGAEPMIPVNQPLLDAMTHLIVRAEEENLFTLEGWETEAYQAVLTRYGAELQQFLDTYPSLEE